VIAIPKRAVMRGQQGTFVWVVGAKASRRRGW
jgi:hypothetical protein